MGEKPVNTSPNDSDQGDKQKKSPSLGRKVLAAATAAAALVGIGGAAHTAMNNDKSNPNRIDATLDQDSTPRPDTDQQMPSVPTMPEAPTTEATTTTTTTTPPQVEVSQPEAVVDPSLEPGGPHTTAPGEMPGGGVTLENPNASPESNQLSSEQIGQAASQLAGAFEGIYNEGIGTGNTLERDPATGNVTTTVMNNAFGDLTGYRAASFTKTPDGQLVGVSYKEVYGNGDNVNPADVRSTTFNLGTQNTVSQVNFGQEVPVTQEMLNNTTSLAPGLVRDGAPLDAR